MRRPSEASRHKGESRPKAQGSRPEVVVGLISDTHGLLRAEVAPWFAGVDMIVHAGDVGGHAVLAALAEIAPVQAVSGNVDARDNPMLPRERAFPVGALTLHVSHGDELGQPSPERLLARYAADILVFGHTHQAVLFRQQDRLVVNPGAAGPRRFRLHPSVAKLTVRGRHADVVFLTLPG